MKKLITISLLFLAQYSFGQIATIKVRGTGTDTTSLSARINGKVDKITTLTINGVTYDLSANRTWTISSSTGSGKVYAGYGLLNVNDSTLKADTSVLKSTQYLKSPIYADGDTTKFNPSNLPELRYSQASRDTTLWTDSTLIDRKYFNTRNTGGGGGGTYTATAPVTLTGSAFGADTITAVVGLTTKYQNNLNFKSINQPNDSSITFKKGNGDSTMVSFSFSGAFNSLDSSKYVGQQIIPTTITWAGTAPIGETKEYIWSQNYKTREVTVRMWGIYTTAGANNSAVIIPMPSGLPSPFIPTGLNSSSNVLYTGTGLILTSITAGTSYFQYSRLRMNSSGTGYDFLVSSASPISATYFLLNITYNY